MVSQRQLSFPVGKSNCRRPAPNAALDEKMKIIFVVVIASVLAGCASEDASRDSESNAGLIPLIQRPMTVDEFTAEIRSGKTLEDLRPRLGVPIVSSITIHYSLADGTISQAMSRSRLIVRRKGSEEQEIIHRDESTVPSKAAPSASSNVR